MENNMTALSIELLFLNDLKNTKVIDDNIYSLALSKLNRIHKEEPVKDKPIVLATA